MKTFSHVRCFATYIPGTFFSFSFAFFPGDIFPLLRCFLKKFPLRCLPEEKSFCVLSWRQSSSGLFPGDIFLCVICYLLKSLPLRCFLKKFPSALFPGDASSSLFSEEFSLRCLYLDIFLCDVSWRNFLCVVSSEEISSASFFLSERNFLPALFPCWNGFAPQGWRVDPSCKAFFG